MVDMWQGKCGEKVLKLENFALHVASCSDFTPETCGTSGTTSTFTFTPARQCNRMSRLDL